MAFGHKAGNAMESTKKAFDWKTRGEFLLASLFCILAGLGVRKLAASFPCFLTAYLPDAIWGAMVFCLFGILLPHAPIRQTVFSLLFSYAIECSQLYHAPWIDTVRTTVLGHLVLGSGFLASDLVCYTVGIAVALSARHLFRMLSIKYRRHNP